MTTVIDDNTLVTPGIYNGLVSEFDAFVDLAKKSSEGDREARRQLNRSDDKIKELIAKIKDALDRSDHVEAAGETPELTHQQQMSLIDIMWTLQQTVGVPCFELITSVDDLSSLPVGDENGVVEVDGRHYIMFVDPEGGAKPTDTYGRGVFEALEAMEDNKVATLFNGLKFVKKDGRYSSVNFAQLNKARSRQELYNVLDVANGKAIREVAIREAKDELIELLKTAYNSLNTIQKDVDTKTKQKEQEVTTNDTTEH